MVHLIMWTASYPMGDTVKNKVHEGTIQLATIQESRKVSWKVCSKIFRFKASNDPIILQKRMCMRQKEPFFFFFFNFFFYKI